MQGKSEEVSKRRAANSGVCWLVLGAFAVLGSPARLCLGQTCGTTAMASPIQAAPNPQNKSKGSPHPLAIDLAVLKGLSPVTTLGNGYAGAAALGANYTVTGGISSGEIRQQTLLPFAAQQQQALRDVFITQGNLAELADGLGTTLGAAYLARAHYIDRSHCTDLSSSVANVIAYANATTSIHSNAGKYFFANATTDGTTPVAPEVMAILKEVNGQADIFGKSYNLPAGSPGADAYGNSRPFQTERTFTLITGPDYFSVPTNNIVYNRGPIMNLIDSPSYPSGHTTYGYMGSLMLAVLVPERYQQMITRGAEYGNDRILVGAHYAMDVIAGRTLATYDLAHLLANDPAYLHRTFPATPTVDDFQNAVRTAQASMQSILEAACGQTLQQCADEDTSRMSDPAADQAFYDGTQTYNLPVVYPKQAASVEDIGAVAPEAGYLLTIAFPGLTLQQADQVLTETEGPGGGFLDNGSAFGAYSRLNLYAAAGKAAAISRSANGGRRSNPAR